MRYHSEISWQCCATTNRKKSKEREKREQGQGKQKRDSEYFEGGKIKGDKTPKQGQLAENY